MKQEELKKNLLYNMCIVAERADVYRASGASPASIEFKPFHPGLSDKLIFNKIIDESMPALIEELKYSSPNKIHSMKMSALNLLNLYYAKYLPEEERLSPIEAEERFLSGLSEEERKYLELLQRRMEDMK